MRNRLKELRALNAFAKKQSVGMQRKLMLYWVSMILVVFAAVILLLSIAGAFSRDDEQLHEVMELHLSNTGDTLASQLDHLTAQSLNLSKELSREIEGALVQEGISLQEVNDDPERLLKLQEVMYPLVNTTLQTANCNGAYVILNATANTTLEVADHSRSGLYLRYTNLSASNPVAPTVVYFRGIPDIARQKDLELHNRWNLEFDTDQIPGCRELMDAPLSRPADRYFWSRRIDLKDTWESARVEDHQLGMSVLDGLPDAVIQHGERKIRLVNGVNLLQVRLGFQQPGLDGVPQTVLGSLVQDGKGFPGFPAGEGQPPAAGRRDPQGQSGLALGWIAVNDGQFPQRDVGIPEPAHRLHHNVLQGDEFQFGLILWQITSHSFRCSQGKGGSSVFNCGKPSPFRTRPLLVLFFGWC